MLNLLSLAWATWKLSAKRLGPAGATLLTAVVIAGYYFVVSDYLEENYPELEERVDQAI